MFWNAITNFIIPTALILLIWILMAHHFTTESISNRTTRVLRKVTLKLVLLTALFLASIVPYSIVFTIAAFETPKSTMWLDWLFPITILNSLFQPIIYISSFTKVREAFKTKVCCRSPKGSRVGMAIRETHTVLVEIPFILTSR